MKDVIRSTRTASVLVLVAALLSGLASPLLASPLVSKEATLHYKPGEVSRRGYVDAAITIKYAVTTCAGQMALLAVIKPATLATSADYFFREQRVRVPEGVPPPKVASLLRVRGSVSVGGKTTSFGDYITDSTTCWDYSIVLGDVPAGIRGEDVGELAIVTFEDLPDSLLNAAFEKQLAVQSGNQREGAAQGDVQTNQPRQADAQREGKTSQRTPSDSSKQMRRLEEERQRQFAEWAKVKPLKAIPDTPPPAEAPGPADSAPAKVCVYEDGGAGAAPRKCRTSVDEGGGQSTGSRPPGNGSSAPTGDGSSPSSGNSGDTTARLPPWPREGQGDFPRPDRGESPQGGSQDKRTDSSGRRDYGPAKAWCRQRRENVFECYGPFQSIVGLGAIDYGSDRLKTALRMSGCENGSGYTPAVGGSAELFDCGRRLTVGDYFMPLYDPWRSGKKPVKVRAEDCNRAQPGTNAGCY